MTTATPEILEAAQQAFKYFTKGLATGEWEAFFNVLTDDFVFSFPVGAFQGRNVGKEKAAEFFHFVTDKVFTEGIVFNLERVTSSRELVPDSSETTVIFEGQSQGKMFGLPYQNQVAIFFDMRGSQVCGYREYLSVYYQLKGE